MFNGNYFAITLFVPQLLFCLQASDEFANENKRKGKPVMKQTRASEETFAFRRVLLLRLALCRQPCFLKHQDPTQKTCNHVPPQSPPRLAKRWRPSFSLFPPTCGSGSPTLEEGAARRRTERGKGRMDSADLKQPAANNKEDGHCDMELSIFKLAINDATARGIWGLIQDSGLPRVEAMCAPCACDSSRRCHLPRTIPTNAQSIRRTTERFDARDQTIMQMQMTIAQTLKINDKKGNSNSNFKNLGRVLKIRLLKCLKCRR